MRFAWRWHQFVLQHTVTYHPAIRPDEVIRDKSGKPAINVFVQDKFEVPVEHRTCSCGEMWEA
jgi:hypothetical protein